MFSNPNTDLNQKLNESINSRPLLRQLFEENNNLKTAINNYDYNSRELSLASESLITYELELLIPILKHLDLETLDLHNNRLQTLPQRIGELTSLTSLHLQFNRLETLPESIGDLANLVILDLHNNRLQTLPQRIGGLANLTSLHLKFNRLQTLPESIGGLTNLVTLILSNNQLTSIPESIGELTILTYLELNYNQLTRIPESIGGLTNLETLILSNNQLTSIPESIGGLNNIEISAERNPLSERTIRWIGSLESEISYDMGAYNLVHKIDLALGKLYPDNHQKVTDIKNSINSEEFINDKNYNINDVSRDIGELGDSAEAVLNGFLQRFNIFNTNDTNSPMLVAARAIFNRIFDNKPLDEKKRTEISKIAISIGNCDTPVMSYLIAEFLSPHYENLKKGENIASEIDDLIAREALEYTVVNELSAKYLNGRNANEKIEKVQALVDAVYLEDAGNHIVNTSMKIEGNRSYSPSKSIYLVFGFKQVRDNTELVEAFLKLVCKEDDKGNLIKNEDDKYKLDQVKIQVIKIRFFEKQAINTPLIKIIKDYKTQVTKFITKMIEKNQKILDFSDPIDINLFDENKQIKDFELAFFNEVIQQHNEPKIDYEKRLTKSADSFLEKLKTKVNERVHYQKNFTVFEERVAPEVQGNYLDRFKSPQIKALNLEIQNHNTKITEKKPHKKLGF